LSEKEGLVRAVSEGEGEGVGALRKKVQWEKKKKRNLHPRGKDETQNRILKTRKGDRTSGERNRRKKKYGQNAETLHCWTSETRGEEKEQKRTRPGRVIASSYRQKKMKAEKT